VNVYTGTSDSRLSLVAVVLEHGVDPQGFVKVGNININLYKLSC